MCVSVSVFVCACMRVCVCVCVRACAHACLHACSCARKRMRHHGDAREEVRVCPEHVDQSVSCPHVSGLDLDHQLHAAADVLGGPQDFEERGGAGPGLEGHRHELRHGELADMQSALVLLTGDLAPAARRHARTRACAGSSQIVSRGGSVAGFLLAPEAARAECVECVQTCRDGCVRTRVWTHSCVTHPSSWIPERGV